MSDQDITDNGDGSRTIRLTGLPQEVYANAGDTIKVGPYFYAVQLDGTYHLDIRRDADGAPTISAIDGDAAVAAWREDRRRRAVKQESQPGDPGWEPLTQQEIDALAATLSRTRSLQTGKDTP